VNWYYEHISLLSSVKRSVVLSAFITYVITLVLLLFSPILDQMYAGYITFILRLFLCYAYSSTGDRLS
jgi:hypothetical protein